MVALTWGTSMFKAFICWIQGTPIWNLMPVAIIVGIIHCILVINVTWILYSSNVESMLDILRDS